MRYVVLHHTDWPNHPDHFDLMLQTAEGSEGDHKLMTFSTRSDVFPDGLHENELLLNAPHRLAYLTFEGAVSLNRGVVNRVDQGELLDFECKKHNVHFKLKALGVILNGMYEISLESDILYRMKKLT